MKELLNLGKIVLISFLLYIVQAIPMTMLMFHNVMGARILSVAVAFLIVWLYNKKGYTFKDIKLNVLYYIGGFILFSFVCMFGIGYLFNISDSSENQRIVESLVSMDVFSMLVSIVFIAPLIEEYIFRNLFFQWFFDLFDIKDEKTTTIYSVVLIAYTSSLFAFLHETTITSPHFLIYFTMGAGLGLVRAKSKKLEYSVLTHMTWNTIIFVIMLLSGIGI